MKILIKNSELIFADARYIDSYKTVNGVQPLFQTNYGTAQRIKNPNNIHSIKLRTQCPAQPESLRVGILRESQITTGSNANYVASKNYIASKTVDTSNIPLVGSPNTVEFVFDEIVKCEDEYIYVVIYSPVTSTYISNYLYSWGKVNTEVTGATEETGNYSYDITQGGWFRTDWNKTFNAIDIQLVIDKYA